MNLMIYAKPDNALAMNKMNRDMSNASKMCNGFSIFEEY